MKKRILVILLAIVLVLSMGALLACKDKDTVALKAKKLVNDMYANQSEVTSVDYEMPAQVFVDGTVVAITWTTDNTKVTVDKIEGNPSKVIINITETTADASTGYTYKLTATIKDADGNTESVTFDRKVPDLKILTWAQYAAAKAGDIVTVQGVVTAIAGKNVFMQDDNGGYYLYSVKTDVKDLQVGQTILATGDMDIYNGTLEVKNANFVVRNDGAKSEIKATDYTEIFKAAGSDMKNAALASKQALLVTIKGVTLKAQDDNDKSQNYYRFTLGEGESYFRISSSTNPMNADDTKALTDKFQAGYTADVTGLVTVYSGAFYLSPISVDALANVTAPVADTDEAKAEVDKNNLDLSAKLIKKAGNSIDLPATGSMFESTITWALKEGSTVGAIANGKYTVATLPATETKVTLVATIKKGDAAAITKEFEITVSAAPVLTPGVIELTVDSMDLANGYSTKDPKSVTVNGLELEYIGLGNYGDGLQWRTNAGTGTTAIYNVAGVEIASIKLVANAKQDLTKTDNLKIEYGATSALGKEKLITLTKDGDTITLDAGTRFFKISHNNNGAVYLDSITITYKDKNATPDPAPVATIGTDGYATLDAALTAAKANDTIVLKKDVVVTTNIVVNKKVTLDLNGKTISNTADIWSTANKIWSLISVREGGELTITGNGKLDAKEGDCFAIDVRDGAKLTIENGEYVGGDLHTIYVHTGSVVINGGKFDLKGLDQDKIAAGGNGYEYMLNLYDASGAAKTATISVTGGSFVNYDPSHSKSEDPEANFVATDKKVTPTTEDGKTIYTVEAKIIDAANISIGAIAEMKGWEHGKPYYEIDTNSAKLTVVAEGAGSYAANSGKYYNDPSWRFYQADKVGTLTITAKAGYTISSVKITYTVKNTGVLMTGDTQVESGAATEVTGNTITFKVGNTGDKTNGQVYITAIEVTYAPAPTAA